MRSTVGALAGAVLTIALSASALAAPTSIYTVMLLHGHLPDLGPTASLKVFQSAAAYDDFHKALGPVDIFPSSSALGVSFDRSVLALYSRGADVGNRCLGTRGGSTVTGDAVELALAWQDGTCGAPAGARYPFILVSLSRNGNDGNAWAGTLRSVCAAAPGLDGTRACAAVAAGTVVSPSPKTPAPTAVPVSPVPTTSPVAVAPPPRTEPGSVPAIVNVGAVQAIGLIGMGLILGVVLAVVYTRWRRANGARTGLTAERTSLTDP